VSAWGSAWGEAWGSSWGETSPAATSTTAQPAGGSYKFAPLVAARREARNDDDEAVLLHLIT
jgi:hypothetical protein